MIFGRNSFLIEFFGRCRRRRICRDPNSKYYNFDVPHDEQEIITEEDRLAAIPKTIQEVLKDVVVYVEVRYGADNRTAGVKNVISRLGAKVNDRLLKYGHAILEYRLFFFLFFQLIYL